MSGYTIRKMIPSDRAAVAELITLSTNFWYQTHGMGPKFTGDPSKPEFHFDVYHTLPGSSGFAAVDDRTGMLIGSCFQHVRPTHVGLGIMNVHPNHSNRGIASALLKTIIAEAEKLNLPVRLVSSAMNLDSFSLYNRCGFSIHEVYQDMFVKVPEGGIRGSTESLKRIRVATSSDIDLIVELEREVSKIERPGDYAHFIKSHDWHVSVCESKDGKRLDGVLVSCQHRACGMIGPGAMRDAEAAAGLILAELNENAGKTPVFLVPVKEKELVGKLYSWGVRNCELHFAQILGESKGFSGIAMPTFLPESN